MFLFCILSFLFTQTQYAHAQPGTLWGGNFGGEVVRIDPSNGSTELVFEFPFGGPTPRTISGLAYDGVSRTMVGVTGGSLFSTEIHLFQFDPFAPSITPVILGTYEPAFASTSLVSGIAFNSAGTLYLNEDNGINEQLVEYDLNSMSTTNVFDLPSPANFNVGGLDVGRNPNEIQAVHASSELVLSIETPNGPVNTIGSFSQDGFTNAIAYDAAGDRYFLSDNRLIEYDLTSGTTLRVLSEESYHGLAFVPVPEPSLLAPLLCSLAFLVTRRRASVIAR